ncbi:hypothetical protein QZH44_30025 (plasmid) [Pseudomonas corrugata]|uniref:hypothetical protein n=1 Tax=Pseudomonas corrugata TaxID=47879 RepID=UPI003D815EA9
MRHPSGTKKQRAAELLARATHGPHLDLTFTRVSLSYKQKAALEAELAENYRVWSQTWLLPELKRLVPELRETQ